MNKPDAEQEKWAEESRKFRAETEMMYAEKTKLLEETIKMRCERQWYSTVVIVAVLGAVAALGKLFL